MSGKSFLVKLVVFPVIFVFLCWAQQALFLAGLRRLKTGQMGIWNKVVQGKVNAEILLLGSSRALVDLDPAIIEQQTGKGAYNLGMNGTQLELQLPMLKLYLRHNRRPECVVQGVDVISLERMESIYEPGQYIPHLSNDELFQRLRSLDKTFGVYRLLPLFGILREKMTVDALSGMLGWSAPERRFQGYCPQDISWRKDFEIFKEQHPQGVTYKIEEAPKTALREILQICRDQQIKVIMLYSPEYVENQVLTRNRAEVLAAFGAIAGQYHVPLWDYSGHALCLDRKYFYNSQHLNRQGATLFTQDLARRLNSEIGRDSKAVAQSF